MTEPAAFFTILGCSASHRPLGTVVHVGAGAALDWALASGARRIVVVDPDPDRMVTEDPGHLERVWAVISDKPQTVPYWRYNLALACGPIQPAPALYDLFPGLQQTEQLQSKAISAADFLEALTLSDQEDHLLFVDMPAAAEHLVKAPQTQKFSRIFIRLPEKEYFVGSGSLATIAQLARDMQYSLLAQDRSDPDFPWICLGPNPEPAQICNDLRKQKDSLRRQLDDYIRSSTDQIKKLQADNEALRSRVRASQDMAEAAAGKCSLLTDAFNRSQEQIDVLRSLLITDNGAV